MLPSFIGRLDIAHTHISVNIHTHSISIHMYGYKDIPCAYGSCDGLIRSSSNRLRFKGRIKFIKIDHK